MRILITKPQVVSTYFNISRPRLLALLAHISPLLPASSAQTLIIFLLDYSHRFLASFPTSSSASLRFLTQLPCNYYLIFFKISSAYKPLCYISITSQEKAKLHGVPKRPSLIGSHLPLLSCDMLIGPWHSFLCALALTMPSLWKPFPAWSTWQTSIHPSKPSSITAVLKFSSTSPGRVRSPVCPGCIFLTTMSTLLELYTHLSPLLGWGPLEFHSFLFSWHPLQGLGT